MHFCNNSLNALFIFNFVNMAIRLKKISWYGMDKIYSLIEQLKWEVEKYKVELKCLKNQLNDRKSPVIFNNKDAILVNIEEIDLPNSPIEKGELSNLLCNVFSKKKRDG